MKLCIATTCIPGELEDKLSAIARAGFQSIEISEQDFVTFGGSASDVGQRVEDHGLSIDLFQAELNFEGLNGTRRSSAFDRLERKFDLMGDLRAELMLVRSSRDPSSDGTPERIAEDLHAFGDRAAAHGYRIGYQPVPWAQHIRTLHDACSTVALADHDHVGLVLDSFQTLDDPEHNSIVEHLPVNRLFHVQISDAPHIDMDRNYLWRHYRSMPGEGDLDIDAFLLAVLKTGYAGSLSISTMGDQRRGGVPRSVAVDAHRALIYLFDRVTRDQSITFEGVPELPLRPTIEGVGFVEFAANDNDAQMVQETLLALGFVNTGQHISKHVKLWQQGEIRLLINTEQDGFAHSAYVMHGTSVCDVGIMVSNARQAKERAINLGAHVFSQRRGKDELDIPAVRGVGGSILHFLDRQSELSTVWSKEFKRTSDVANNTTIGLTRIDHIAQTMTHEELRSWSLFYEAIFRVNKTSIVTIDDPGGPVTSRALQSPEGDFRLTLNGADSHRSFAGRFLANSFGSSVQHLAFASQDIFESCKRLAANGFEVLPVPENYYVDLASSFDLTATQIDRLKEANLFYDRDEQGEYYQLFSMPYTDGFFFEIVERVDGYRGYGERNAAYRTAILKRFGQTIGMPKVGARVL